MIGISTYARLFIGFSSDLASYIVGSARVKSTDPTAILPITILSEDQVSQSLSDPLNESFRTLLGTSYADNLKTNRALIKGQETLLEQRVFLEEALRALDEKKRTAPLSAKSSIDTAITALNNQYKQLNNIKNAFDHNEKQLSELNADFSQITTDLKENRSRYKQGLAQLNDQLAKLLRENGLPDLPSGEVENLLRQDSWQELLDRFYDTGASKELPPAELERILNLKHPSYETYFKLKAYLAIRSVHPSRENMGKYLKQLDPYFTQANEQAKTLNETEQQQIKTIAEEKIQPVLKTIESNQATLELLHDNREQILTQVTTAKDLATIEENIQARIQTGLPRTPEI